MSPTLISAVLTALAAVVVVLTRLRLARDEGAGQSAISLRIVNAHTAFGVAALVLWTVFLVAGTEIAGVLGLIAWWITAGCGLLILARWLPSSGKRAAESRGDSWGEGPGLSMLGHIGLVVGAIVWTVFYAVGSL